MDLGGFNLILLTIVGALVLAAVIAWAALRNRRSRNIDEQSERATHRLYEEEDKAHQGEGNDVP